MYFPLLVLKGIDFTTGHLFITLSRGLKQMGVFSLKRPVEIFLRRDGQERLVAAQQIATARAALASAAAGAGAGIFLVRSFRHNVILVRCGSMVEKKGF